MKIQLLRNTVVSGQPAGVGEICEVSEQEGKFLITIGKAKIASDVMPSPQPAPTPSEPVVETAELPQVENAMKARGKRKEK